MQHVRGARLLATVTVTATVIAVAFGLSGCGKKRQASGEAGAPAAPPTDARTPSLDAHGADASLTDFAELAGLPRAAAVRAIELPTRIDVPRFEVHGPVVSGGVAVVASSQLGFAAIDWKQGKLMWSKPAGSHVAPPLVLASGDLVLLGDCAVPPSLADLGDAALLGCLRVVTSAGVDRSYGAVLGEPALAERMRSPGEQRAWVIDERHVAWQRGETSATVELATGQARRGAPPRSPLVVRYKSTELEISLDDEGALSARKLGEPSGKKPAPVWKAPGRFAALLGTVPGQPYESPMLRVVRASAVRGVNGPTSGAYFDVIDLDAMTAAGGQAAFPSPGIQLLGTGGGTGAAAALAVRLDRSLRRDYVVAYTSSARIAWAYPLPVMMRSDPVGLAIVDDAVLAFHDGDTLTVLPPAQ
jgi:hypothetical protein